MCNPLNQNKLGSVKDKSKYKWVYEYEIFLKIRGVLLFSYFENQETLEYYKLYFAKIDEILDPLDDIVVSHVEHEEENKEISEINVILIKILLYYL
jgi:hypothetical protein